MNEFQAFAALVLNSVTESIVRLRVLKFSVPAFIALTLSWLLIRTALTMFSVISFDCLTNSSVYGSKCCTTDTILIYTTSYCHVNCPLLISKLAKSIRIPTWSLGLGTGGTIALVFYV